MSAAEAAAFERQPHLSLCLNVRRWDDAAKVAGRATPDFAEYFKGAARGLWLGSIGSVQDAAGVEQRRKRHHRR